MAPIRVLVADDHTIVRQGLVGLLRASGECEVVGEAADGLEAVEKAQWTHPDVIVLDVSMPHLSGIEVVRRIRGELPATRILVLTMHEEEEYVLHMVRAGAAGYLVKDSAASELLAAVRALASGQDYFGPQATKVLADQYRWPEHDARDADSDAGIDVNPYGRLTDREREVFHLVVEGRSTKEIARALGISFKTAENHRSRVLAKLGLRNTAELVRYAARKGLLT
ncbi:MAG TPA: response regulator transcription factor [Thermoanaerobaculia bacterium]|nr:response regulator transcription factor [Thermoanaerobaculia bacterium]